MIIAEAATVPGLVAVPPELAGQAVEGEQAATQGAEPDQAGPVFVHRPDDPVGQPSGQIRVGPDMGELLPATAVLVQALSGSPNPEIAARIFQQGQDDIAGQAAPVPGVVPVPGQPLLFRVEPEQALDGAKPQGAAGIPVAGHNVGSSQLD